MKQNPNPMKPRNSIKASWGRLASLFATLLVGLAATDRADAQPQLVSVQPTSGSVGVPRTASIVFTFDRAMEQATLLATREGDLFLGSLVWSANINLVDFTYQWNGSSTVLTCDYTGDLPGGALITWRINPASSVVKLGAEEDLLPVPASSGSFTTAGINCDPDGIPDNYGSIFVSKSVTYLQNSTAAPVLKNDELPAFAAFVNSPAANAVTAATLLRPGSVTTPLQNLLGRFYLAEEFDTQALLDQEYPAGAYTLNLTRETPPHNSLPLTVPANTSYPPVPQINNYTPAQTINPAIAFTLTFGTFVGATANDYITLEIEDDQSRIVLSAPDLCIPLALPVNANSLQIPANTLQPGKTYTGRLTFGRTFYSSTTIPAFFSTIGALTRSTVFFLTTTGGSGIPSPQIVSPQLLPGGPFIFTVNSLVPATVYRAEVSTTLLPGSWSTVKTINIPTGSTDSVIDINADGTGRRYYRVIKP